MKKKSSKLSFYVSVLLFLALIVGLAMPMQTAKAATLCVNPGGTGGCYATIQAAIDVAGAGDIVNVATGTYNEQITISKPLTVTGADGAVLDGTGLAPEWTTGVKIKSGNVTFNNIDVTNFTQDGIIVGYEASIPGSLQNVHITNSKISNIQPGNWGFGIYVGYESEGWGYTPPKLTTHLDYSGLLIEGNEITNVNNSAVVLQSITGTPGTLVVRNNSIHDNTTNDGIWIDCARTLLIENNTVVSNLGGIDLTCIADGLYTLNGPHSPKNITLSGNFVSDITEQGIALYTAWPGTITVAGNSIQGNGTGIDNLLAETLIATLNWWGASDGPGTVGPGSGDHVSTNVDYTPWLCNGTDTSTDPGFQPNVGTLCPYQFTGFFRPIDNNNVNKAKAGQTIPAKWRLTDYNGVPISDAASFVGLYSYRVSCTDLTGVPLGSIEEYAPGTSGLRYQGHGYWRLNWKTPKTYAGTCRAMYIEFNSGATSPKVYFQFKKK